MHHCCCFLPQDKLLVFDKEHAKRTHVHDAQVLYTLYFILLCYLIHANSTQNARIVMIVQQYANTAKSMILGE
jgi:hypothetical protein